MPTSPASPTPAQLIQPRPKRRDSFRSPSPHSDLENPLSKDQSLQDTLDLVQFGDRLAITRANAANPHTEPDLFKTVTIMGPAIADLSLSLAIGVDLFTGDTEIIRHDSGAINGRISQVQVIRNKTIIGHYRNPELHPKG